MSELTRRIWSIGMPRTSLASMANAVWWPWPWELVPTAMVAVPSSWTSTAPYSMCRPIGAVTSTYDDRPMPSCTRVAALAPGGLLGAQRVVPGGGEHGVERLGVLAGVVVGAGQRRQREGLGREVVAAADLGRVDAELVGGDVEHPLDELGRLRPPGAAVGAGGRVVGDRRHRVEVHLRARRTRRPTSSG